MSSYILPLYRLLMLFFMPMVNSQTHNPTTIKYMIPANSRNVKESSDSPLMIILPPLPPALFHHKIDELMSKDVVDSLPLMFSSLGWATKMVAAGVILEGPELGFEIAQFIKELRHAIRERADIKTLGAFFPNARALVAPKKPRDRAEAPRLILILALVGWAAVAVGVIGEWKLQDWGDNSTNAVQTLDSIRILEAQTEAGNARVSAEVAAEAASQAKREAGQVTGIAKAARSTADDAKAGALDAKGQVVDLRSQTASLQRYIDEEKERITRIETPRHL